MRRSDHAHPTVHELTERELIARIESRLPPPPDWAIVGIGDDAAVVQPERNRLEVLSVDALVEGIHFDRAFTPPEAIGHRALAVNLSDLAAMGAAPRAALLSLALPEALPLADFDAMIGGFATLAAQHGMHLAGGNLTRSPGPLMADVTVIGTAKPRRVLTRRGARAGDEVYVSGTVGAAAAGLQMLKAGCEGVDACVRRYLYPDPRVRTGLLLARNRAATSCMDLSDGLADGVHQLATLNNVGIALQAEALPIEPSARRWFEGRGADPIAAAVAGGDDYELLFTVRPRTRGRLAALRGSVPVTRIGVVTDDRHVVLRAPDGCERDVPEGYTHFRRAEG